MTLDKIDTNKQPTHKESMKQIDRIIINMIELRNKSIEVDDITTLPTCNTDITSKGTVGELITVMDKICQSILLDLDNVESSPIKEKTLDEGEVIVEELEVKKVTLDKESKNPPKLIMSNNIELVCGRDRVWSTHNINNPIKIPDEELEMFETLESLVTYILSGINVCKVTYTDKESEILQEWLIESDKYYKVQLSGKLLRKKGNNII